MSLTQEQMKIALEHFGALPSNPSPNQIIGMFDAFLSRIREEQEPSGYFRDGWNGREEVSEIHKDEEGVEPLFSIPQAASNCNRLAEVLQSIVTGFDFDGTVLKRDIYIAKQELAKHKASMGEKE